MPPGSPGSLEEVSEVLLGVKVHFQEEGSRSLHLVQGEGLVEVGSNQETQTRSFSE